MDEHKYWVFVSYNAADRQAARRLHSRLEAYRVPKALVGTVGRKGIRVPHRITPCYIDYEELGADADLPRTLRTALDDSRAIVVVCSPSAAGSTWVEREVAHFSRPAVDGQPPRTIHAWIVDGDPPDCFPPSLRANEPAACDVRPGRGAVRRELVRLVAAVVGVDPSALWQREKKRRLTRTIVAAAMSLAVASAVAWFGIRAWQENRRAESLRLASESMAERDPVPALDSAIAAVKRSPTIEAEQALSRALTRQRARAILQHDAAVYAGRLAPDGQRLVTGTKDGSAVVWDVPTGNVVVALRGHTANIEEVTFSHDGRWIATAAMDGTARLWNPSSGACVQVFQHGQKEVNGVVFSAADDTLVTTTESGSVLGWRLGSTTPTWTYQAHAPARVSEATSHGALLVVASPPSYSLIDAGTGTLVRRLPAAPGAAAQSAEFAQPAFSPDGIWAAAGDLAGTLRVWDVHTGTLAYEVAAHTGAINRLAWSPDSGQLATASEDARALVFNVAEKQILSELKHTAAVEDVVFSPDGYLVATAGDDNRATVWSWSGERRFDLEGHRSMVWGVTFSPDGSTIATVSVDRTARLWSTRSGLEKAALRHPGRIDQVALSGDRLLVKGDRHLTTWDISAGHQLQQLTTARAFRAMSVAETGSIAALVGRDQRVHVLDKTSLMERCATPEGALAQIHRIALSSDGSLLLIAGAALAGPTSPRALQLWDPARCTLTSKVADLPQDARLLLFAPSGGGFVCASNGSFLLWGRVPPGPLYPVTLGARQDVNRAAFSDDGQLLLTAYDGGVVVWDVSQGKPLSTRTQQSTRANPVVFSHDARRFLSTDGFGKTFALAPREDSTRTGGVEGGYPDYAMFSPSGRQFVTSRDASSTVWDTETGSARHHLPGSTPTFLKSDTSVLTILDDKVLIHDLDPKALLTAALNRRPRVVSVGDGAAKAIRP